MSLSINDKMIVHKTEPNIFCISDFLSQKECTHVINVAKPFMKPSLVSNNKQGQISQGRSSTNAWIYHNKDSTFSSIAKRIANVVGIPIENAEAFQVIYYGVNGEYRRHYDAWEHDNSEKTLRCMKYGGNRIKTALVYLNDVESGGSTSFPRLNIDVTAEKGKLLVFDNTYKNTNIKHPLTEHAGMPVKKGEKYAFNLWFRECNFKRLYSDFKPSYYQNALNTIERKIDENNLKQKEKEKTIEREKIEKTIEREKIENIYPSKSEEIKIDSVKVEDINVINALNNASNTESEETKPNTESEETKPNTESEETKPITAA